MKTKKLPIYKASYEMLKLVTTSTKHFSRSYRPTLGKAMQDAAMNIVISVYKANAAEGIEKVPHINNIFENSLVLATQFQLSFDLRQMPIKPLSRAIELIGNIERQAGGWRKFASRGSIDDAIQPQHN